MPDAAGSQPAAEVQSLRAEIVRLNKIIAALMDRAERDLGAKESDFGLFQTAILLENQVRERTQELEAALRENEKINRDLCATQERLAAQNVKMQEARDAADAASRAKSQFLANMSHELRTPLNSLLILSQLLMENAQGNLTPKQTEYAGVIHRSGCDLLEMINDLLDLAKIEAGRVTVEAEEVRFDALREGLTRSLHHLADEKRLAFAVELAPGLPPACYTDAVRLQQVLRNLLFNAIKFTPAGRVVLRIAGADAGWRADHPVLSRAEAVIAFAVSDTGIGIAPDKQRLIFEAFQQAESGTARRYGGTGLGLSISREIANLLGGELTLLSTPGAGSTFTLYLPIMYAGAADGSVPGLGQRCGVVLAESRPLEVEHAREGSPQNGGLLAGRKLLLVDDDIRNVFALTAALERHHLIVITAESGRRALELLPQHPDIAAVLMDIMMPDMDGYEATRRIRAVERYRTLPIIALTAKAMKGDRELCLEAGCSDFLSKPVDTGDLLAMLRECMQR